MKDDIKVLDGYKIYEDTLNDIDEELTNINNILKDYYSTIQSNGIGGKLIYSTIKLSELKKGYLDSKIGLLKNMAPKDSGEGEIILSQAMLDEIMKATANKK